MSKIVTGDDDPEADESPRLPARRAAHVDQPRSRPDTSAATVSQVSDSTAPTIKLTPFEPRPLVSTRIPGAILIGIRVAMLLWAVYLSIVSWHARSVGGSVSTTFIDRMTIAAAVLGASWLAAGALWSERRTSNVHRLEGRFPTRARAVRSWIYPLLWVALMAVTAVRAEPHPEFDVRPLIIVGGFMITMLIPYLLIQRLFRSLVRIVPDAPILVLYVLDVVTFGLIWWRLSTWPRDQSTLDAGTLDLLVGSSFAATAALLAGLGVVYYLNRSADYSQVLRELMIRTRHDQRIARVQGLDPMDPGTRWALWLARRAVDEAEMSIAGGGHVHELRPTLPMPSGQRAPIRTPSVFEVSAASDRTSQRSEGARVPVRSLKSGRTAAPIQPPTIEAPTVAHVEPTSTGASRGSRYSPIGVAKRMSVLAETGRANIDAARTARSQFGRLRQIGAGELTSARQSGVASGGTITDQLAARVGADLARGGGVDFVAAVRELSERYDPAEFHDQMFRADTSEIHDRGDHPGNPEPPRLIVVELLRYLALAMIVVATAGCAWTFLVVVDIERVLVDGSPEIVDLDLERLQQARSMVAYGIAASHILVLGWLFASTWCARNSGILTNWRRSSVLLCFAAGAQIVAVIVEDWSAGPLTMLAAVATTLAAIVGLRNLAGLASSFGNAVSPINSWIGVAAATVVLLLISPLGGTITGNTASADIAGFAAIVGLMLSAGLVLAALVMSGFENSLKASPRLAKERTSRHRGEDPGLVAEN